jgi:hypothetical protein
MARLASINDPVYAALPAVIERGMGLLPHAPRDGVELGDVLPVRRGRADLLTDPTVPIGRMFVEDGTVHVQILVDQAPRFFARVQPVGATRGESWRLARITESAIAAEVEAGIDLVQNDPATEDETLTLLEVPAYYFVGLLLSGRTGDRVLPVDLPDELGMDRSAIYDLEELRERLRSSTILGRRQ